MSRIPAVGYPAPFPFTWDLLARRRVQDTSCRLSRSHFPLPGIFWHEDVSGVSGVGYPAPISLYLGSFGTKTCPGRVGYPAAISHYLGSFGMETCPGRVGYPAAISHYLVESFGTKKCPGYRVSAISPPFPFTWDLLARRPVVDIGCRLSRPHFPFTWDLFTRRNVRDIGCRLSRRHFPVPGIFWREDVSGVSGVGYPAPISLYLGSFGTKTCPGRVGYPAAISHYLGSFGMKTCPGRVGYPAAISLYLGSFGTKTCPGYRVSVIPP